MHADLCDDMASPCGMMTPMNYLWSIHKNDGWRWHAELPREPWLPGPVVAAAVRLQASLAVNCTCTFINYLFIAKTSISIRCKYNPSNAWFIHKLYSRCFFGKRKHLPPILLVMACSWFLSSRMWVSNFTTWRWWIAGGSFCLGRITILGSYLDSFSASSQKTLVGKIGCNKRWQPTFSGDLSLKVYGRFWEWEKGWFEFRFFVSIAVYFLDHSCPKFEKVQHLHTCS